MRSLFAALGFLTILPVPASSMKDLRASLAFFPVVGLLLGLVLWGLDVAFDNVLTPPLTSALLLVSLLVMTRGLHLEGFMDTCDGILGGGTKQRRLEIMKDSHVGAFALMGGISLVLLKWTALLSLPSSGRSWSLILFPALSRWSMMLALVAFPYARSQGLGSAFQGDQRTLSAFASGLIAIVAALLLAGFGGLVLFGLATLLAWLLGKGLALLLGGLTGDTYGAINEVTETVILITAVGLSPLGLIEPLPQLV